ncbi:acyl-CoA dehydrogenase family protein [Paraburkholderia sp. BL10I2N1]|uniref:acyl-CoA dehydrogenase family protein n=1 Tax=Paraburkholderia sp. BL10I2N1 TaxID=1938796 RepID=UPI001FB754FA|nr:acyl-CoA dehydrogenase family protein [Paraburkholderia sp. BL10I2N1]
MIALLSESAGRYVTDHYGFLQRRAVLDDPSGYSAKAWRDYAEFGWLAMRLPETHGGLDADAVAIGAVMEVVGSHLLMEPVLASMVVGTGLVIKEASDEQKAALLPVLADGSLKLAFASGAGPLAAGACVVCGNTLSGVATAVLHGDIADRFIVSARTADAGGELALFLVDASSSRVNRRHYRLVDGRGAATIRFDNADAERLGAPGNTPAEATITEVGDEAVVALCAETLGIVRALMARTCEYLKVRTQFGKPIGVNQALQHRAADMFLMQQEISALTRAAQRAMCLPHAQRARIVSGARAYIGRAARHVANEAVQMHGGLGVTDEMDVSHYFRRLMVNAALFGSLDEHFTRFVDATLPPAARAPQAREVGATHDYAVAAA